MENEEKRAAIAALFVSTERQRNARSPILRQRWQDDKRMTFVRLLFAVLLASGAVVGTASANEPMTQQDCQLSFDAMADLANRDEIKTATPVTVVDGRCHVAGLEIGDPEAAVRIPLVRVDEMNWTVRGLEALDKAMPPHALDLNVIGAYSDPFTGMPGGSEMKWFRWSMGVGVETGKRDLHLAYEWDPETHDLTISDFSMDSLGDNDTRITASFSNVDMTHPLFHPLELSTVRINEITFETGLHGLFEELVVQLLGPTFGETTNMDPEVFLAIMKSTGKAWIAQSPDDFLSDASGKAIAGFLDTLPHPRGHLSLAIKGPEGGMDTSKLVDGVARYEVHTFEDVMATLSGFQLAAEWEPDTSGRR